MSKSSEHLVRELANRPGDVGSLLANWYVGDWDTLAVLATRTETSTSRLVACYTQLRDEDPSELECPPLLAKILARPDVSNAAVDVLAFGGRGLSDTRLGAFLASPAATRRRVADLCWWVHRGMSGIAPSTQAADLLAMAAKSWFGSAVVAVLRTSLVADGARVPGHAPGAYLAAMEQVDDDAQAEAVALLAPEWGGTLGELVDAVAVAVGGGGCAPSMGLVPR